MAADTPRVTHLFTSPAAGERMWSHASVQVVSGLGILGDRYATRTGHWSAVEWKDQQLTIIAGELLDELGIAPPDLRRNIVTRGIDLHDLIGLEFQIGSAILRGKRICAPCGYIQRLNQRPGLFKALDGRGGIRVRVVSNGTIAVGDEVRILGVGDPIEPDDPSELWTAGTRVVAQGGASA
ncbi:MAG: MOSC domain-containing protein [Dehalococcoidia bacterium]